MSYKNSYYLHFAADLRRVIFCMQNNDPEGAKTFLEHAQKIFEENLKKIMDGEAEEMRFADTWNEIYLNKIPDDLMLQKKCSEKLLTLSSMIIIRSTETLAPSTTPAPTPLRTAR